MDQEEIKFQIKILEQTERFEKMRVLIKEYIENNHSKDLTVEFRNFLSIAYKNSIGMKRQSWRQISYKDDKMNDDPQQNVKIEILKSKIEAELSSICNEVLDLLQKYLIPVSQEDDEAQIFYNKMVGDYYRYMSEYLQGQELNNVSEKALKYYTAAFELAKSKLTSTHPIKLGLALNFSVFYYECMNNPVKACDIAKTAFDDAIADIEFIKEDDYKDTTTIMQLIRDNLTLWNIEDKKDE